MSKFLELKNRIETIKKESEKDSISILEKCENNLNETKVLLQRLGIVLKTSGNNFDIVKNILDDIVLIEKVTSSLEAVYIKLKRNS